jgi:hypothetical protein
MYYFSQNSLETTDAVYRPQFCVVTHHNLHHLENHYPMLLDHFSQHRLFLVGWVFGLPENFGLCNSDI